MALGAEAHDLGRQYKQREMCFSLQAASGQSGHPWAVCSVGEKSHQRMKGVLLLQNHTVSACSRSPPLRNVCLNRVSAKEKIPWSRHFSGDIFSQSLVLTIASTWGKFTPNGHWWKLCSASWCNSSGCRKRSENGALPRPWWMWGRTWDCNSFGIGNWLCLMLEHTTNLDLFGKCILVNQLFLEIWSHSSQKKTESLSWNQVPFYIKIHFPTSLSFSS